MEGGKALLAPKYVGWADCSIIDRTGGQAPWFYSIASFSPVILTLPNADEPVSLQRNVDGDGDGDVRRRIWLCLLDRHDLLEPGNAWASCMLQGEFHECRENARPSRL